MLRFTNLLPKDFKVLADIENIYFYIGTLVNCLRIQEFADNSGIKNSQNKMITRKYSIYSTLLNIYFFKYKCPHTTGILSVFI